MEENNPIEEGQPYAKRVCGAKLRNKESYCQKPPMANGRCKLHGGMSPGGISHYNFQNKGHSKYYKHLPKDILEGVKAAEKDGDLCSLRDDLNLLTAKQITLLDKLKEEKLPPWQDAVEAMNDYKCEKDKDKKQEHLEKLEKIIREGVTAQKSHSQIWEEMRDIIQEKTKTSSAEWKRLNDISATMTVEQAMVFVSAFLAAANKTFGPLVSQEILQQFHRETLVLLPSE